MGCKILVTDLDPFTLGIWILELGYTIQTDSSLFISSPDSIEGVVRTFEVCRLAIGRRDIARGTHDGSQLEGRIVRNFDDWHK